MKRKVVGSHRQCMRVIARNKHLGDHGYDYYEMYPTTEEEWRELNDSVDQLDPGGPDDVVFLRSTLQKHYINDDLHTLILYRDQQLTFDDAFERARINTS